MTGNLCIYFPSQGALIADSVVIRDTLFPEPFGCRDLIRGNEGLFRQSVPGIHRDPDFGVAGTGDRVKPGSVVFDQIRRAVIVARCVP